MELRKLIRNTIVSKKDDLKLGKFIAGQTIPADKNTYFMLVRLLSFLHLKFVTGLNLSHKRINKTFC